MLLGAIAELATLGALLPFLSLLAGVEQPTRIPFFARLSALAGGHTPREQMWIAALIFATIVLLAGGIRLALNWWTHRFTSLLRHELTVEVQRRILMQPYAFHLARNSSQSVATIATIESLVVQVVVQLIQGVAAAFIAIVIIAALIYVDPLTATIAAVAFSFLYLLVSATSRARLARNAELIGTAYEERIRIVQEGIGGIRDVIIDGAQSLYLNAFSKVSRRYAMATASNAFIASSPRFIVESLGMVVIAFVAVLIAGRESGLANALPVLGAVALGAQRLLPLLQQAYHSWASVSGHSILVSEVVEVLRLPIPADTGAGRPIEPLPMRDKILVERVSFAYPGTRSVVLHDVILEISRGMILGVVGTTGGGKTTLADLIMGLIEPTDGRITVDGVPLVGEACLRWQRGIAHVPQAIFLADASIERNIAFGVVPEHIDQERVRHAASSAQLHDYVASLPHRYDTVVGERGIRLSGGQRQRLGIARAIYKGSPVLVLDEATSALDDVTEAAVMESLAELSGGGRTIIIIAHRLSTLAQCTRLVRIEDGRLSASGSYAEVVGGVATRK